MVPFYWLCNKKPKFFKLIKKKTLKLIKHYVKKIKCTKMLKNNNLILKKKLKLIM